MKRKVNDMIYIPRLHNEEREPEDLNFEEQPAFDTPDAGCQAQAPETCFENYTVNHTYKRTTLRETESVKGGSSFTQELEGLINRFSEENNSNTPDFILAKYMANALDSFNIAVQEREKWYGRKVF
ncbi:MAG: hypothetical protein ABSE80_14700 [Halobacteriota archaeon]